MDSIVVTATIVVLGYTDAGLVFIPGDIKRLFTLAQNIFPPLPFYAQMLYYLLYNKSNISLKIVSNM